MSVAFTNLYAALVKTLQSGVLFFAMTQRISPAAVIVKRPGGTEGRIKRRSILIEDSPYVSTSPAYGGCRRRDRLASDTDSDRTLPI
jgi:hypothetical protein